MNIALTTPKWLPAHVPPELAWDGVISEFAAAFDDPFIGTSEHLHAGPDILYARGHFRDLPGWLLTRHDHIGEAYSNHELFSSADWAQTRQLLGVDWALNPLEIDPPMHDAYRDVLKPFFSPGAVNRLDGRVRQICRELIAAFEDKGGCEFIADFASLFPSYIFLSLMGMPREKLPQFLHWEHMYFRGETQEVRIEGLQAIFAYMTSYAAERRADPGDDLMSAIVTAQIDGRLLDDGEVMGMAMVLYTGGLDTVLSSLGWYFRHLARDPALQARLKARPADIPHAVDEFLRAFGITNNRRLVTRDCEFHGVQMKKGDWISLPNYLASRDAREFADPHVIDIDRRPRHVTLARGIHFCLGAHLARREIKIVLEEFLSRFSNIRIPQGERERWHTQAVWGVDYLPLEWDR